MARTANNKVQLNKKPKRGVHSKAKTSKSKRSKNYVKPYRGQGR